MLQNGLRFLPGRVGGSGCQNNSIRRTACCERLVSCADLSYGPCLCKPTAPATSLSLPPAMTVGHKCQERKADVTRRVRLLLFFFPLSCREVPQATFCAVGGIFKKKLLLSRGSVVRDGGRGTKRSLLLHFVYHCVRKGADRRQ